MSALMQALRARFLGRDECRVIVVGLDGCGKTTIVHRLKHGALDDSEIIPTVGFNVECVEHKKMIFSLWDLGGAQDARTFWRFYYPDTQAVIFVIDSSDINRMDEAREDLHRMLTEHELWDAPLLVLANKHDLPNAMDMSKICEVLQLYSLSNRNWYIIETQATHPDPLETKLTAGLDWLVDVLLLPAPSRQQLAKQEHQRNRAKQAASSG
ncbi:ADP-ribosylation factor [Chrysochromulina tobinii]|uniref:ADP-ribosylation factor n=1 Tax=Chrysochromulina tobinii TaxID=1460289 RepID=A0A0M0JR13_9EUKA|nr:ADP-ribosylation factor [Chrysochromulina tobinii]|eukprot:KOO28747.1 ADP-ribosylation factor [Chrysochromulina sp. CCMP291]